MTRLFVVLLTVVLAAVACHPSLSTFDKQVNNLIHERCSFDGPCQITVGEATNFDWDEIYVFRPGLTAGDVEAILPAAKGFHGEFNRKMAFLKQGHLVKLDEAPEIIEGENTPPGMLFFEDSPDNDDCLRYPRDAEFKVKQESWSQGNIYKLACANCQTPPVFAGFGSRAGNSQP